MANIAAAMPMTQVTHLSIEDAHNARRKYVRIRVENIDPADTSVLIDTGVFGLSRIISLRPQPLSTHFNVVWNGDTLEPRFSFDGYIDEPMDIEVEAIGV